MKLRFRCISETSFSYGPVGMNNFSLQLTYDPQLGSHAHNATLEIRGEDLPFIVGSDYYLDFSPIDGKILRSEGKEST